MDIKTKFNKGDALFFINNSKVVRTIVQGFKIEYLPKEKPQPSELVIIYLCNSEEDKMVNIKVYEEYAFPTKEKLLKSL